MNNISQFNECANCGACYNACPTKAIKVLNDGFFYSLNVDNDKCIDCGKCIDLCPVNNPQIQQSLISAVGGYNKDSNVVKRSSSGGAFYAIAEYVLSKGGIVFGAVFTEDNRVVEIKGTDDVNLEQLLRSKYVESLVGSSFINVKAQLNSSRLVLFCGCPCQVAGLKRYLGKDYDNLITCDFSCGGLPSHKIYNRYIDSLEKKYNSKIKSINFRPKSYGWETYSMKICFENGKEYNSLSVLDPFYIGFIHKHYTVRDNCLTCRFADNHYSDIVLADFWKYQKLSDFRCGNGLSLIITNSLKGKMLLSEVSKSLKIKELSIKDASYNMTSPNYSKDFFVLREEFLNDFKSKGLDFAVKKLMPTGIKRIKIILKSKVKYIIKKCFKLR